MDDLIYRTKKRALIIIVFQLRFQDSIRQVNCVDTLTKCIA